MPLQNLRDTDSGCFFVWREERRRREREGGKENGGKEGESWDMKSVMTKHILCILARW